jgi:hypothetical protein
MSTPSVDAAAVQALVSEVLRRIRAAQPAAPGTAPAVSRVHAIADRVITLAHLDRVAGGIREVAIDEKSVITPSARDRAKELGLTFVRHSAGGSAASPAHPFVIAQAACRGDASSRAAAIARAIPQAQQLPASGLADVIASFAVQASKDAARGVLLTSRPAVAVILANRSASLRAVTARDAAGLAAAASDTVANLLIIDPAQFSGGSLERLCVDFHRTPSGPLPAELTTAPAGCGCKGHGHEAPVDDTQTPARTLTGQAKGSA